MQAARDEMRRSMDQRHQIEREEHRENREKSREGRREGEPRKDRNDGEQKQKPPKMVMKLDVMTGKLEFVPEQPGC
jgi:hypothetical protein